MTRLVGQLGRDPRTAAGRSLAQLFLDRAAEGGEGVAMRAKRHGVWEPWSWRQVLERVRSLAAAFAALGLRPGDTVAMIGENLVELYWLEYASLCRGLRVVCLYPDVTAEELAWLVAHSGARLLVAEDQEQVDKALAVKAEIPAVERIVHLDDRGLWHYGDPLLSGFAALLGQGRAADTAAPEEFGRAAAAVRQEDVAALCYTSGTTGRPKGVMLTHRYLLDNAYRLMSAFGLRPGAEYLSYISPAWAAEQITGLALGLLAPLTVNFAEKPETIRHDLRELGPEFLLFTPRQWEMMAAEVQANILDAGPGRQRLYRWAVRQGRDGGALGRLLAERLVLRGIRDNLGLVRTKAALSGGAGMSAEVFRLFRAFGVPLSNLYGSTEMGLVAVHWSGRLDPATMGELLPVDPTLGEPLAVRLSDEGELLVEQGAGFHGYWRDAEAGAALLQGGAFHSGDAVALRGDGQLLFLDRMKDLRRLAGGERYPPQFIENHLRASPFIKEAMVLGDETRPYVTALVNIDAAIAGRLAERLGLAYGTFAELSQLPAVRAEVEREVARVNALLAPSQRVRRFATLPKELDPDEAELTRSRKLRRGQIEESYRDLVEALYGGGGTCEARIRVRYQDGRSRELQARVEIGEMEVPA